MKSLHVVLQSRCLTVFLIIRDRFDIYHHNIQGVNSLHIHVFLHHRRIASYILLLLLPNFLTCYYFVFRVIYLGFKSNHMVLLCCDSEPEKNKKKLRNSGYSFKFSECVILLACLMRGHTSPN